MKNETCEIVALMESVFWSETRVSIGDHRRMEAALAVVAGRLAAEGFGAAACFLSDHAAGRGHG
jgi:hypothetical protein